MTESIQTVTVQATAETEPRSPIETMPFSRALNAGLRRAMAENDRVLLMGEDIGRLGGVFRVTEGLQAEFGEQRVLDTPLAESGIVGTAIGLAMGGFRPVCEIQFDGFVFPAFDQITSQLAKITNRHEGAVSMPVVIRIPYGGHIGAVEHHQESPEVYFAHTPGLRVVSPSTPNDAYWMIQDAITSSDPVIFLEPKSRYWQKGEVDTSARALPLHATPARAPRNRCHARRPRRDGRHPAAGRRARRVGGDIVRSRRPALALPHRLRPDPRFGAPHGTHGLRPGGARVRLGGLGSCGDGHGEGVLRTRGPCAARVGLRRPVPPAKLEGTFLPDADRILEAVDRTLAY